CQDEIPGFGSRGFSLLQEGALDLLKSLTGYTMTIQLLQTTRIGVAVNSVRKHCSDEEVVASAKILIKNWKRLLGE
uniref:TFIIS N-terminal domain-containing protein n=1 Tax=Catharus ustulatus TaxID=91951 RepID=A0A8C3UK16_CATUS